MPGTGGCSNAGSYGEASKEEKGRQAVRQLRAKGDEAVNEQAKKQRKEGAGERTAASHRVGAKSTQRRQMPFIVDFENRTPAACAVAHRVVTQPDKKIGSRAHAARQAKRKCLFRQTSARTASGKI